MVDELDQKILNVLLDDSRLSYRKIAKRLGTSVATIMNHVNKLQDAGIIKKYTAEIDYYELGYNLKVMIRLGVESSKYTEVAHRITSEEGVLSVYNLTGNYDVMVLAHFKSRTDLNDFLKNLQSLAHVKKTHTSFILDTIKECIGTKL